MYIIDGQEEEETSIRKSRKWNIPICSLPEEIYTFETQIYEDNVFIMTLTNINDKNIVYEIEFNYDEIAKAFQVLPQKYKDEMSTLIDYQVFISGLVNNNKLQLFFSKNNRLRLEFEDIAKAPKGAMYNVTIFVPRI